MTLCEPTTKADVDKVAIPAESVPVPSVVVPSLNVTIPVGVPVPEVGATVAVKVTDWPNTDGSAEELRVVAVGVKGAVLTVSDTAVEVDVAKLASPKYTAVKLSVPAAPKLVVQVATPPLFTV